MRAALNRDRFDAGVGENNFVKILRCGIALVSRFNISVQQLTNRREITKKLADELVSLLRQPFMMLTIFRIPQTK